MAVETKDREIQKVEKQEIAENGAERTRTRKAFVPQVDIYETDDELVLIADMPGVVENSLDISLEKNVLTVNGSVDPVHPNNYGLAYAEYEEGDYQRSFTLSNAINVDRIEATLKNGVLRLRLPKVEQVKPKKIAVKSA